MRRKGVSDLPTNKTLNLFLGLAIGFLALVFILPRLVSIGDTSACAGPTKFLFSMMADMFGNVISC